jgi:hypothetical protein
MLSTGWDWLNSENSARHGVTHLQTLLGHCHPWRSNARNGRTWWQCSLVDCCEAFMHVQELFAGLVGAYRYADVCRS